MCHSWASKRPQDWAIAARLLVLFLPSDRFALGIKGGRGGEGKGSSITNRQKVVYDESKDVEEEALLFNPQLLLWCGATSERCVCGGCFPPPAVGRWCPAGAVIEAE